MAASWDFCLYTVLYKAGVIDSPEGLKCSENGDSRHVLLNWPEYLYAES